MTLHFLLSQGTSFTKHYVHKTNSSLRREFSSVSKCAEVVVKLLQPSSLKVYYSQKYSVEENSNSEFSPFTLVNEYLDNGNG